MLITILYIFVTITVLPVLLVTVLSRWYLTKSRKEVINVHTKKPINDYVNTFESLYERLVKKRHPTTVALERAQRFDFKPFLSVFLHLKIFIVNDPELAKKMLLNWRKYEKQSQAVTPWMQYVMGQNVVFANGDEWKKQRSVMNPAFFNVDRFLQIFGQKANECLNDMVRKCNKSEAVNVPSFMTALALDVLGATVFGHDFEYLKEMTNKELGLEANHEKLSVIDAYEHMMNNMFTLMQLIGGKRYTELKIPANIKFQEAVGKVEGLIYSIIDESRKRNANGTVTDGGRTETLIDMMIASVDDETKQGMDSKTLRDNSIAMFIAGHDTTSTALSYELYVLGKYPHIQEKVLAEIEEKIPKDREATVEEIDSLEYMNMFIKESLRMYPPIPSLMARLTTQRETLGDYAIPKGSRVTINIYSVHHNPHVWDIPFEFRPERFNEENSKGRPSTAWMPFGGGPRACVGLRFSLLEKKVFLITLLQRYKVVLPDPNYVARPDNVQGFLLAPPKDLIVSLQKRN